MFHEAVPPLPCAAKVLSPGKGTPICQKSKKDEKIYCRPFVERISSTDHHRTRGRRANRQRLPLHLVGLVAIPEVEGRGEVATEVVLLLDAGEDVLVDGLLVASTSAGNLLLL